MSWRNNDWHGADYTKEYAGARRAWPHLTREKLNILDPRKTPEDLVHPCTCDWIPAELHYLLNGKMFIRGYDKAHKAPVIASIEYGIINGDEA
jgi:hypothetical protein